eukprot:75849_1
MDKHCDLCKTSHPFPINWNRFYLNKLQSKRIWESYDGKDGPSREDWRDPAARAAYKAAVNIATGRKCSESLAAERRTMQRWLNPRAFLHFKGVPNATYLTGQNLYWYRHTLNGSFELNSGVAARPTGNRSNHTPNDPKYPPPVRRHPVLHPEYSTETHPLLAEMQNREENVNMVFDSESDQESINVALVNNHNHNKSSSSRKRPLDLNKSSSSRKKRKICTGGDDPKYPP